MKIKKKGSVNAIEVATHNGFVYLGEIHPVYVSREIFTKDGKYYSFGFPIWDKDSVNMVEQFVLNK